MAKTSTKVSERETKAKPLPRKRKPSGVEGRSDESTTSTGPTGGPPAAVGELPSAEAKQERTPPPLPTPLATFTI